MSGPLVGLGRQMSGGALSLSGTLGTLALSEDSRHGTPSVTARGASEFDETMKLVSPSWHQAASDETVVKYASSIDPDHPAEHIFDGSSRNYWISTGLYPQEILVELGRPLHCVGVKLEFTGIKGLRIEGCTDFSPINFEILADEQLLQEREGLQVKELICREQEEPTRFVKVIILSGSHDFCSVHRLSLLEQHALASKH